MKSKKKVFTQNSVPFFAQYRVISSPKPDDQLAKGGQCLNFAHFFMQVCNPSDPKVGALAQWPPPLNTPLMTLLLNLNRHQNFSKLFCCILLINFVYNKRFKFIEHCLFYNILQLKERQNFSEIWKSSFGKPRN